jgi:hypothetical protein
LALVIGFLAARWYYVQAPNQPSAKKSQSYDFGALQQLESFMAYLQKTGQTNTLQKFNDYTMASLANQFSGEMAVNLIVLQELRSGRTNQAYTLLEHELDSDIVGFVGSYRQLPPSARELGSLAILQKARDYRAKYPFPSYPGGDQAVADAFKILDEKSGSN